MIPFFFSQHLQTREKPWLALPWLQWLRYSSTTFSSFLQNSSDHHLSSFIQIFQLEEIPYFQGLLKANWAEVRVCMLSCFNRVLLFSTLWPQPTRLYCPWDSPGKNTGVDCPALLQGIFPTQGSNPCLLYLLHWQIPHHKCHLGSPGESGMVLFSPVTLVKSTPPTLRPWFPNCTEKKSNQTSKAPSNLGGPPVFSPGPQLPSLTCGKTLSPPSCILASPPRPLHSQREWTRTTNLH